MPLTQTRRRVAAVLLVALVVAAHGLIADWVAGQRIGQGAGRPTIQRIEVAFVRELQPSVPVAVALAPPTRSVAPTSPAASAPLRAIPEPVEPPALPPLSEVNADLAGLAPAIGAALALPTGLPPFEWPPSTRLSYVLTGHYRGPVDGSARVEWLRSGSRYQVHLDVAIGPAVAPLIARQMSSEGELGNQGLSPRRYEEHTRFLMREPQTAVIRFADDAIELPGGRRRPQQPGVQDAVSQFVQLTWRFTLEPALLEAGRVIEVPLALPRAVQTWVYDVMPAQTLWTPAGAVEAVRVKPRRAAQRGGDLVAETWFAPSLQFLPVRIVIRQDDETYIDLLIDRLPEQAESSTAPRPSAVGPASAASQRRP